MGWAASMNLWWAGLVRGDDDPRMLLVVLGFTILAGAYGARGHRDVILRLTAYASLLATLAWLLRPLTSGTSRLPREWHFANRHFQEFYPSLIVPFAILGGIIAVAFAKSLRPGGMSHPAPDLAPSPPEGRISPMADPLSVEVRPGGAAEIPHEWQEEFEAAAARSLETRFRYSFIRTYRPVLDDAPYRAFDTTADYRRWCEENLPDWLGYGRI